VIKKSKYKLAKEIGQEYDRIKGKDYYEFLKLSIQEKLKVFEELCELDYELYKAARKKGTC